MKKLFIHSVLLVIAIATFSCESKKTPETKFYNDEFKWSITIPKNFEVVSEQDWEKHQQKGADALEKTIGEEVINQSENIFIFRNGLSNYFEANKQPFDETVDGDYLEAFDAVNEMIIETFKSQMPEAKIDKKSGTEIIDNLEFQSCQITLSFPNNMTMKYEMFSRLFGKNEFTVNIIYIEDEIGKEIITAFKNSKFEK